LDRDENAARKIWELAFSTVGHTGTSVGETGNASGDWSATVAGESLFPQDKSLKEASARIRVCDQRAVSKYNVFLNKHKGIIHGFLTKSFQYCH
jgi:hypothetical protein